MTGSRVSGSRTNELEQPPKGLRRIPQHIVVAVVFVAGMFMEILDTTIVNTALPAIALDFGVGTTSVEWVAVGYLLSLAVFIPASGWVGDRFGDKRTLLIAIALFTMSSVLCATASSLAMLVTFRVLQGAAGGLMAPVGTAMLFRAFPPERRAKASQVLIVPTVLAPTLGPLLGGLLVDELSWPWIFWVNVPLGIAAVVFGWLALDEHRAERPGHLDLPGFVLSGSGLALGLYALTSGPREGWASVSILATGLGGVALLAVFVVHELRTADPLLDLRLFSNRLFRSCNLTLTFTFAAFLAVLFAVPLYLQQARGYSAWQSGLTTFPEALGVLTASQLLSGRYYARVGPRRLILAGLLTLAVVAATLSTVDGSTSLWFVRACMFVLGMGLGLGIVPQQAATFATVDPAAMGRATAIYSTIRQVASALGVAMLATVLATSSHHATVPAPDDFRWAFLATSALALVGALVALTIHDSDAAATMRRGPVAAAH